MDYEKVIEDIRDIMERRHIDMIEDSEALNDIDHILEDYYEEQEELTQAKYQVLIDIGEELKTNVTILVDRLERVKSGMAELESADSRLEAITRLTKELKEFKEDI